MSEKEATKNIEQEISLSISNAGSRSSVTHDVYSAFMKEPHGSSTTQTKYKYFVETLANGERIYLRRPAALHYGFDFIVFLENHDFSSGKRKRRNPSHKDILTDLENKIKENPEEAQRLFERIRKIYDCNELTEEEYREEPFRNGLSCELILKTLKWLFIEQDIRYWLKTGREMLMDGITSLFGIGG